MHVDSLRVRYSCALWEIEEGRCATTHRNASKRIEERERENEFSYGRIELRDGNWNKKRRWSSYVQRSMRFYIFLFVQYICYFLNSWFLCTIFMITIEFIHIWRIISKVKRKYQYVAWAHDTFNRIGIHNFHKFDQYSTRVVIFDFYTQLCT